MKRLKNILSIVFSIELLFGCAQNRNNKEFYLFTEIVQKEFNVSEPFNHDGLEVSDNDTFQEIKHYKTSIKDGYIFKKKDVGNKKVVISKSGYKDAYYVINITDYPLLNIISYPQLEYVVGDYFSLDGLEVSDGHTYITSYDSSIDDGTLLNEVGTYVVEITKQGYFKATFTINVNLPKKLSVKTNPSVTSFDQGDEFSSSGLVIQDESEQIISDYTLSIKDGDVLKNSGEIKVKVTKENYQEAEFTITVNEKTNPTVKTKTLNIYYINDTHGSFIRQELEGTTNEGGMAYIGQYIMDKRSQDASNGRESLVLSGGDMFQGGIESNLTRGKIMTDAMNIIGFDAMVLGNHEFDWGESYIKQFANDLNCPIISSNTFYSRNYARPDYISPFTIIDRGDLRIGIIGGAEEDMGTSITGSISNSFAFPNPVNYIKEFSTELRLSYNCDLVFAAFHDEGYDTDEESSPTKFSALTDVDPLTSYKYVDAMFFAHDHYRKTGSMDDVPYLEAGCNGRYVGVMTLKLESDNYKLSVDTASLVNHSAYNYCTSENAAIANLPNVYRDIIGDPDETIYTFKKSYTSDAFTAVVCHAMYWYVNEHLDLFDNTRIYLASHNLGGVRAAVNKGKFTRRDLFKVFPFENQLCIQICTELQINRTIAYSYYETYQEDPIVYDKGYTHAVSITYITESKYARNYQSGYTKYPYICRDALCEFLINNIDNTI